MPGVGERDWAGDGAQSGVYWGGAAGLDVGEFGGELGGVGAGVAGVVDAGDLIDAIDLGAGGDADVGGCGGGGVVDVVGVGGAVVVGVDRVGGEGGGEELHRAHGALPGSRDPPPADPGSDRYGGGSGGA